MIKIKLEDAENRLADLVEEAAGGEEVIIQRGDGWAFRLVPFPEPKPRPRFGSAKGLIQIAEDFDEPLADFRDYEP
jgi:antitoxin (DNA-binding transcriptional repressor) of toxin-antitoxin stability system